MITLSNIGKRYGSKVLYADASLQINSGEKIGLVGPNGAGKTTIFRLVTGAESVDDGYVSIPKNIKIGYFRQDIEDMRGRSVIAEVLSANSDINRLAEKMRVFEKRLEDTAVNPIDD